VQAPPNDALEPLVRKLMLHHPLGEADQRAVLNLPHRIKRMEALAHAVREGDQPVSCAVLLSGYAFRHKLTGDGSVRSWRSISRAKRSTSRTCS